MATVCWLVTPAHPWNVAKGIRAVGDDAVCPFNQIGANVFGRTYRSIFSIGIVVVDSLVGRVGSSEPDNHDMHAGFAAGLACPWERPVSKVDLYMVAAKKLAPEDSCLFALRD